MIALDTNVLVRYFALDDTVQSTRAVALIEQEISESIPVFVNLITLAELIWTLRSRYRFTDAEQQNVVKVLLGSKKFVLQNEAEVYTAIRWCSDGHGFADALIEALCASRNCTSIKTFDSDAAGMGLFELI